MKKSLFVPSVLFVIMFVLSACGGAGPSTTIDVTFTEFTFTPAEFTIPAGQEITINATNNGAVVHEFVIMKFGETVGDDFGDEDQVNIYWEVQAEPGASVTATFTAPTEPGEYQVVCGTLGHYVAGMIGKLIVVAGK
jgi:plastocyanin